jgi:hypothetical protein
MVFARCPAARLESASQKSVDLMRHTFGTDESGKPSRSLLTDATQPCPCHGWEARRDIEAHLPGSQLVKATSPCGSLATVGQRKPESCVGIGRLAYCGYPPDCEAKAYGRFDRLGFGDTSAKMPIDQLDWSS